MAGEARTGSTSGRRCDNAHQTAPRELEREAAEHAGADDKREPERGIEGIRLELQIPKDNVAWQLHGASSATCSRGLATVAAGHHGNETEGITMLLKQVPEGWHCVRRRKDG